MSRRYGPWRLLGLDKTSDTAAIRSAYARALKAMDVDADPRGFQALRDARQQALAQAQWVDAAPEDDFDDDEEGDEDEYFGQSLTIPGTAPLSPPVVMLDADAPPGSISAPLTEAPDNDHADDAEPRPQRSATEPDAPHIARPVTYEVSDEDDHIATMDAHYQAILRVLFEREEEAPPYLDDADEVTLMGHVEALLVDPRLEGIEFHRQAETWFADIAAAAIPRSDRMIQRITDFFGWTAGRGRIDQPAAIARCVGRRDSLTFFQQVQQKSHPLNRAWRELCRPADEHSKRSIFVSIDKVKRLIRVVRRHFPDLESCFDWRRVAMWERGNARWWMIVWPALVGGYALLMAIGAFSGVQHATYMTPTTFPSSFPTASYHLTPPTLDNKRSDIAFALKRIAGGTLSYAEIVDQNPKLDAQLSREWQQALSNHTPRDVFAGEISAELRARYRGGIDKAPRSALVELRQIERDKLTALRKTGSQACNDWIKGGSLPEDIAARFTDRENALTKHVLLATFAPMQVGIPPRSRFMVPGAVMKDAAERAGLTHDQLVTALNEKGSPAQACNARIALIEASLALSGAEGTKLLREM